MTHKQQIKLDVIINDPHLEYLNYYFNNVDNLIVEYKRKSNGHFCRSWFGIRGGWLETRVYKDYDYIDKKPFHEIKSLRSTL